MTREEDAAGPMGSRSGGLRGTPAGALEPSGELASSPSAGGEGVTRGRRRPVHKELHADRADTT